jgi:flavodoxin short chain
MKEIVVIYWSGTGNTEMMAEAIGEGAKSGDANVKVVGVDKASVEDVTNAEVIALGCPSMGDEELEESEMEPFVDSIKDAVKGKKVALFGSYGWGSGEWMEDWQERMKGYGAELVGDGLIINETPDEDGLETCKDLGKKL